VLAHWRPRRAARCTRSVTGCTLQGMRLTPVRLLVMLGITVLGANDAAHAQGLPRSLEGGIDVGSARLSQADVPASTVLTLASQLRYSGIRGAFSLSGIAAAADEGWTAQGLVSGSVYAPPLRPRRWELTATASTFGLTNDPSTSSIQLTAREHFTIGRGGLFAGIGGGGIVREQRWRPALLAHVGGYARLGVRGTDQLSAALSFTDTKSEFRLEIPFFDVYHEANPATYSDAFGYWQHDRAQLELLLGGGARFGMRGVAPLSTWMSASATWWVTPRLAVVAGAGRALEDIVRGVPTTRYASLALRVALRERSRALFTPRRPPVDTSAPSFVAVRLSDRSHMLRVRAAAASSVEMMADFTDWEPVALDRNAATRNEWIITRTLAPGTHRVALRIDGGAWTVPINLPKVDDEFGGTVGLVTIP
jgi:hypothetical protein